MKNLFVYLVGPPGIGKFTIGRQLAEKISARLIDNHCWLNPIFALIKQDGITPLPEEVWDQTNKLRAIILETIASLSPRDWNFVFTHAFVNHPRDQEIAKQIFNAADKRSADILVVRLTCAPDELAKRVINIERQTRFKEVDPEAAKRNALLPLFDPGDRKSITIDTTHLTAENTVEQIMGNIISN